MVKALLKAARLRTLPLAISAISTGSIVAAFFQSHRWIITILAVSTAVFLQVLSNFANDYGDFKHGVDQNRVDRALSGGDLRASQMKRFIVLLGFLSFGSGITLLYVALGDFSYRMVIYLALGLLAIVAAIRYTAGRNPYGYKGLGDLSVFIFFGLLSVSGVYFLQNPVINKAFWMTLLPASSFGLLSVGVLNINNIRDINNDKAMGKMTLAVYFGKTGVERYQLILILLAFACICLFIRESTGLMGLSILLLLPIYILHWWLLHLLKMEDSFRSAYNRLLKQMVLLNAAFVVVLALILLL